MSTANELLSQFPFTEDELTYFRHNGTNGVYAFVHTLSGKVYVGSTNNLHGRVHRHLWQLPRNKHRNRHLQNAYNKSPDITLHLIVTDTREEAYDYEQQMIDKYKPLGLLFNHAIDARYSGKGYNHTPETIAIMRQKALGRTHSDESKRKIGLASKGRSVGLKRSDETKAKMSAWQKGRKATPEQIEKNRLGHIGIGLGRKLSPETIQKLKERAQTRSNPEKRPKPVLVEGVRYDSITEVAKAFNLDRSTVQKRLKSQTKKFQNWTLQLSE